MASTNSTGHQPNSIVREQFSSSGQVMFFSSGCEADFDDGSVLRISTGATANIAGTFTISGTLLDNRVQASITTTGGTITNNGLTVVAPGATSDAIYTLATPAAGSCKNIIVTGGSSHEVRIINASSATYFGVSSSQRSMTLSSDPYSANLGKGNCISLQATGTARWQVLNVSATSAFAFSSGIA